jgi:type IV secretory pathway VirB2 component (pilin)
MRKIFANEQVQSGLLTLALMAAVMLLPYAAVAANMDTFICNAVSFVTGSVGKAIATVAILILGIGAFFGKVTWGLAVLVAIGMGGVFGAASVVNAVSGAGAC